jgi:DNA-binding response OmpR family regulator
MTAAAPCLIVDDESRVIGGSRLCWCPKVMTRGGATGKGAQFSIAENPPDLILPDAVMPGLDGRPVAKALKADPAAANVSIITVTAQTDQLTRLAGLEAGELR